MDSHSKWLEVLQCKRPTTNCTIGFLHELFARFGVVDCMVTDDATQFTSSEFRDVSSGPYYNASVSPQVEWAGQEVCRHLKRALKKALGTPTDRALQQFLQVYRITPNPNTPMRRSPAETMFARKIKSVIDKLIPRQAKFKKTVSPHKKHFCPGDKVLFKAYKNNMTFWEVGTVKQRIGELVYIVQGPKNTHKCHMNQLRKCCLNESEESPQNRRNIRHASSLSGSTTLGKKKKIYATTRRKSQEAEVLIVYFFAFFPRKKKKTLERCCETETYLHHGLFQHYITSVVISDYRPYSSSGSSSKRVLEVRLPI